MKKIRRIVIKIELHLDLSFWALIPALNINLHTNTIEFEFLCFGIYSGVTE